MDTKNRVRLSKFLSKHLRHSPGDLGLTLEPGGWVSIDVLLAATARHGCPLTHEELAEIVADCNKQRFAFDETGDRIRANQGHSVEVDLQFEVAQPPEYLYHGTVEANLGAILASGLDKMRRHHVHLSKDIETAVRVGSRHGKPVVLSIAAGKMSSSGFTFFLSVNGVWLVESVPPGYLTVLPPETILR